MESWKNRRFEKQMQESTSDPRILVVDDEPDICELLTEMLSSQGLQCKSCASGAEALELLSQESFALVISDFRMTGMSGLELLDQVQARFPRVAFVMLTGEDNVRLGVQAMKQGAQDYLVKSFQTDDVVASIHRALEKKRLELELDHYRQHLEQMVEQRTKQLQSALKRVEMTYDETLLALGGALDLRDNETAGHSHRVTSDSLEIAKVMGCTAEQLREITRGAYLHDLGKIGVPDAILLKPGSLTDEERKIMESHVRIGYNLVSQISFLAGPAEIVLTHQERYDGTGYPQGLVGNEIPLGARIFAVADTLDAMTSDRPYRRALPFSSAKKEITDHAERQFDPEVVRAFLSIPEEVWQKIRNEVVRLDLKRQATFLRSEG